MTNSNVTYDRLISCDPGKTGALCIFHRGELEKVTPVPIHKDGKHVDVIMIDDFFQYSGRSYTKAIMENVHSMPTDGRGSIFSFGKTTGQLIAMMRLWALEYEEVRPQDWKKCFGLKGKNKEQAVELVEELQSDIWEPDSEGYPKYFFWPKKKTINKDEKSGIADAYLIGKYAISKLSSSD